MTDTPLEATAMVWALDWQTPAGEKKPVELSMHLTSVNANGEWMGTVRVTGYPAYVTEFPVMGCDWIQAYQMMLQQVKIFLGSYARSGPLFWRGTSIEFTVPEWRRTRRPTLFQRLYMAWRMLRT